MQSLIGEQSTKALVQLARHEGIGLQTGPFRIRIKCDDAQAVALIRHLYSHHPLPDSTNTLFDFSLGLRRPYSLRRWWRPQIRLTADAQTPFEPFPRDHAYPLFEWGYNWHIAMQAHQYLMLHSAVVEKDGLALIMPAMPGSGKSTLCAALMLSGWRLLSDEFGLIRPLDPDLRFHPMPRPVPLKNRSIEVIRNFSHKTTMGPVFPNTRKGDVSHLAASTNSQLRAGETAKPGWFLFPQYGQGLKLNFEALSPGWTFLKITGNSFNYRLQGARGFRAAAQLVKQCPAYALHYSDLDGAIARINSTHAQIIDQHASGAIPRAQ